MTFCVGAIGLTGCSCKAAGGTFGKGTGTVALESKMASQAAAMAFAPLRRGLSPTLVPERRCTTWTTRLPAAPARAGMVSVSWRPAAAGL